MKNIEHPFDPIIISQYAQKFTNSASQKINNEADTRSLFYQLNQPGNEVELMSMAYDFLQQGLMNTECVYSSFILDDIDVEKLAFFKTISDDSLAKQLLTQDNEHKCVKQSAAILLTQPCWLQNVSQASCSQAETAVQLMSIYLQLRGENQGDANMKQSLASLLLTSSIEIPALHSYSYSQQADIIPEMIAFASSQLALARFPRILLPEILGFTLAYFQMPTLLESCFLQHQLSPGFFKLRYQQVQKQLPSLLSCITNYLQCFPQQKQALWRRIQLGFWFYQLHMQRCRERFVQMLEQPLSSSQAVAKLFQKKTIAAQGHHQNIQLQGMSLDQWFAGMPANHQQFLEALKQSSYVNKEQPLESSLLALFDVKGPMFGVLNQAELDIIKNWLKDDLTDEPIRVVQEPKKVMTSVGSAVSFPPANDYALLNNRALYYYLVNKDLFPDVLPIAQAKAGKLLKLCACFNSLPFKQYSHQQLDTYIENSYQREINAYQPLRGKPKISREAYVWGLEQIAPMILIDGCWLQQSQVIQNVFPQVSEILFSIYCDEIGNGQLDKNHPYIFQQLLDSLSVDVPAVYSTEFVKHSGFINSAFDLPVYMLSLSSFSVQYLPELLGLNMAIELSGLGRGYMGLVDEWNYWGIDPAIASIHISIDNYVSGHTFLAKKAIQLYMDEILFRTGDRKMLDKHWQRIYCGYASLRFAGTRFKAELPLSYLINKVKHRNL
ncbi:MAG: iron-containing redox enzyme family protein [Methylococcaceae bacterium]